MAANAASLVQASPPRRSPTREPAGALALSGVVTLVLGALLVRGGDSLLETLTLEWRALTFWAVLILLVSSVPLSGSGDHEARLTLDDPILLAMAFLYPPEVAALVAYWPRSTYGRSREK